ncbi:MAG: hypothetical protein KC425_23760, partial [Anaerolineales bacterium]|nr:hypothetical protein [Anaerolineales bacterium]
YTAQPLAQNLNVSLRLLDTAGAVVAQFDAQPGYGFRPSSGWPAGQWVHDWLALPLPEALPETAVLQVQLYEIGGDLRLVRRLGTVERAGAGLAFVADVPQFEVPAGVRAETAEFRAADEALIRLRGHAPLAGPAADGRVTLTLYWEALAAMPADYTRFVHVLDASGALVAQADAMPRGNSYPTSQWQAGEIVADAVALDVADLPPGEYRLAVGFYENVGGAVVGLTAVGANGQALPDGRVVLAKTLVVEER